MRATGVATVLCAALPAYGAGTLLEEFHVIGVGATPYSQPIDLDQAGDYTLLLTDREFPAPLDFVAAGVVRGAALLGMQSGAGTTSFGADAGSQTLYVVGTPAAAQGSGSFGVEISTEGGDPVVDSVGTLQAPSAAAPALAVDRPFTVATPATYTLTLTDRDFPAALDTLEATVIRLADQSAVATLHAAGAVDFDADAGDYELFLVGDAAAGFGLLSFELRSEALGLTVFAESAVVDRGADGSRLTRAEVSPGAGEAELTLTDFGFPAALASVSARVLHGADVVGAIDGAGSVDFVAEADEYSLLVYAQADAAAGSGTFGSSVNGPAGRAFEAVDVVSFDASDAAPAAQSSFDIGSAGAYALTLTDFEFPLPFASMQLALLRGSQVVDILSSAGTVDFDATPGTYAVAVVAEPTGTGGTGLLGVRVTQEPEGALVFEDTQPLGTLFASSTLRVTTADELDLVLTDAAFPARFLSLALALTQGTELVGFVFGGGTLSFDATPGDYAINVLASPDATLEAGAYGLTVAPTLPPPPPPPDDGDGNVGGGGGGGGGGADSPLWLAMMSLAWGARRLRDSRRAALRVN